MHVPGWHEATEELRASGRLRMVGILQEQHPDRARLFMQWKGMGWPLLVDALNLLGVSVVPITALVDEAGIVRALGVRANDHPAMETFLSAPSPEPATAAEQARRPELAAPPAPSADAGAWQAYGEALALWGGEPRLDRAIDAFERAAELAPGDGPTRFRLGVAYRQRHDSERRRPGDFQRAVAAWSEALSIDPNQYIWRRRIQQYGPRLAKPYPFYDWIAEARQAIRARGETPVTLAVEPGETELAGPLRRFAEAAAAPDPDPDGRIHRDRRGFVTVEPTVVPPVVAAGGASRIHLLFRPQTALDAYWNNEAEDLAVWVDPPVGWKVDRRPATLTRPPQPVSREPRTVELELRAPADAEPGTVTVPGYALYYVCEKADGTCLYRRLDLELPVEILPR